MALQIYNTLSRSKETFEPLEPGKVSMYVCGPTVYASAHIGHAMSTLVFDIVRRYLQYRGYAVAHAMNYTDVDDKIIQRANHEGRDPHELAESYIQEYDQHLEELNILPATIFPRATEEIPAIIDMVARLLEDDYAYVADGDVYFRVEKKDDYGKLSGRKLEDMQAGARIGVDERKEHPMDFAVWKAAKEGEPAWDSPWGPGRPGWHIECSAMVLNHLGPQIDIHGGGNDLVFPHHENEIAQTESLTHKPFARFWMHNGMMQLSGEKMSKSLGNLITIKEFLKDHDADVLRMMVLGGSYRGPLTFGDEAVEAATRGLERLRGGLRKALPNAPGAQDVDLATVAASARREFEAAMDDDFNSSAALAALFELVRQINQARDAGASDDQLQPAQIALLELGAVFGLRLEKAAAADADPAPFADLFHAMAAKLEGDSPVADQQDAASLIDGLLAMRQMFRAQKQWEVSDQIRDQLAALNVIVEDSPGGSSWHWA